jgi:hypothetical protein
MPYYTCQGTRGAPDTISGYKSRGYHLYRRGCVVFQWWGPIIAIHKGRGGISIEGVRHWSGRQNSFASVVTAKAYLEYKIEERLSEWKGYDELLNGKKIRYVRGMFTRVRGGGHHYAQWQRATRGRN